VYGREAVKPLGFPVRTLHLCGVTPTELSCTSDFDRCASSISAMGNSCAKGPPREANEDGADSGEKAGFRDRRLSVSQVPSEKGSPNRRLSVYNEDTEPAAEILAEIPSVAVKSVAGMEPVPGGATRKINQVRACSSAGFISTCVPQGSSYPLLVRRIARSPCTRTWATRTTVSWAALTVSARSNPIGGRALVRSTQS